jgi:transposase
LADKGYTSEKHRLIAHNYGFTMMIAKKKGAKINYYFNKTIYKKRIVVEHWNRMIKEK